MVVNDFRPAKRLKRRVTADPFVFFSFPSSVASDVQPFRYAVGTFLSDHGRATFPPTIFPSLLAWQILLRVSDPTVIDGPDSQSGIVALDVVEEDVARSSRSVYCDQCRVVGWSGHPVCQKRYHFIIRAGSTPTEGYQKACPRCGHMLHLSESRCNCCNYISTSDDLEDWVYHQFDDNTHLLHAVVHSNGYGHLLTVNGREGGSNILSGCDIMNFWDRLCRAIGIRKVSVMDVSKKYGMEYRLLNTITKGHSWYGNWGYEFGYGSYGLTREAYLKAVDTLSNVPLSHFLFQGRRPQNRCLQEVIAFYMPLSDSELLTMNDLFTFLLRLIHCRTTHKFSQSKESKMVESDCIESNVLCAWTREDVESVQERMIKVLLAAHGASNWVSMRTLKFAVCKIASPEMIDYCLQHFGGKLAGNDMVVQARNNSSDFAVEFRLVPRTFPHSGTGSDSCYLSKQKIIGDLKLLYDSFLNHETMVMYGPQKLRKRVIDAVSKLMDCKQFIKDYKPEKMLAKNPFAFHYWCHVEILEQDRDGPTTPPELIVLPSDATVADLKSEAAKSFEEVYAIFKRFEVDELPEYGPVIDSLNLRLLIGSGGSVRVRGKCPANYECSRFKMERGIENWTVDCICGTKDDDGERMLACDTCSVWQHTRCVGIVNSDPIPEKFVCSGCAKPAAKEAKRGSKVKPIAKEAKRGSKVKPIAKEAKRGSKVKRVGPSGRTCGSETMKRDNPRGGTGVRISFDVSCI